MKRFLFSILVVVAVLMIVGTVGDMYPVAKWRRVERRTMISASF